MNKILFTTLLLCCALLAKAQFNFKIGYDPTYINLDKVNFVSKNLNEKAPVLDKKLQNVKFMNGIEVGLRYRINNIALEGGWCTRFVTRNQVFYTDASKETKKTQFFNANTQTYNLGATLSFGKYGFGATVDRNFLNFTEKDAEQSKRLKVFDKSLRYNSTTFFLQREGQLSDVLSFVVRPYVQLPTRAMVNIKSFQTAFAPQSTVENPDGYEQNMTMLGIKFIFFNGEQNK
jgi:hypothetical protein